MKKIVCLAVLVAMTFGLARLLCGCFNNEKATVVTTYDELVAAKGNIKLANDIDCDFATVNTLKGNINGCGYTIKNAILSGNALFNISGSENNVKNIVIENVTYHNNGNNHASIVSAYNEYEKVNLENITVKNCTMKITQGESQLYAGIFAAGIDKGKNIEANFKNCRAENVKVEISGSPSKFSNIYYGGLMGNTINDVYAKNCSVTDCEVNINGKSNKMFIGGLIGGCTEGGEISECFAKDTFIFVEAPWYSSSFGTMTTVSEVQLGGLIGHFDSSGDRFIPYDASGTISLSYVSESDFRVASSGSSLVGGLAGYFYGSSVEQSYSCDNHIAGVYYDYGKLYYNVGGILASAKNCAVTSCFSCKNIVRTVTQTNGISVISSSDVAGFISSVNSVATTFCGVGMNEIYSVSTSANQPTDERLEEFIFAGTPFNCFATSPVNVNNSCGIETVNESLWYVPQEIKNKLNLINTLWEFETGELPFLKLL